MSDFLIVLWLSTMMWVNVTVLEQQNEVSQQLAMVDENMAVLWVEAESTTKKLKTMREKEEKMKTYTAEELKEILEKHRRWLLNIDGTKERADLHGADLHDADLSGADLSNADLHDADLHDADLSDANLYGADLRGANLSDAYLHGADLHDAYLYGADLSGADLSGSNLHGADLSGANLCDATLHGLNGNIRHVKSLQTERYYITYTSKVIQIGCKRHTIDEWKNFDDEKIRHMDSGALEWWKKWKPIIMQIIEIAPCEETKYENTK